MKELLEEVGIVPVIVIDDADHAVELAEALVLGGLPVIEITLRTDAAADAIEKIARRVPAAVVGAGTVLNKEQFKVARDAGARFIVSPSLNASVVEASVQQGLPVFPGIVTPSELQAALDMGLDTVKFFPAEAAGGVGMLRAISSVYSGVKFMPTGGISPANLKDYLSQPAVAACGGSWLAPKKLIAAKDFAGITRLAADARKIVEDARCPT